ncbi:phycobilin lyase, CpcS-I subunit (plasmid) [Thalassoporum mexicanum PCC 7367]|uniref:phycobiliprotein lyase n=1 Tax=Thalassoporum mexicanum TaxID=3457544 RepID=UPI00029FC34A|nr:phycobiliprotein lyase [Pseudanabaena sp. PCC 7367]AFY72039.1 phycobilin lyase, CpcS-I subunit [Pseudanabaena sp. PCC 7367]
MDAMQFFRQSSGNWRSQRTTHHLAFRRSEIGDSAIYVETLSTEHPKIAEICAMHEADPNEAIGGAFVTWQSSMAWDQEKENHVGETIFVLIPTDADRRQGKLLRERGYAEITPIVGEYHLDEENGLVLITDYETTNSYERFWFVNEDVRLRASTVKRFGGFSTATFCIETKETQAEAEETSATQVGNKLKPVIDPNIKADLGYSILGW